MYRSSFLLVVAAVPVLAVMAMMVGVSLAHCSDIEPLQRLSVDREETLPKKLSRAPENQDSLDEVQIVGN